MSSIAFNYCIFIHYSAVRSLIRNWNRQLTPNLSLLPNLETNQFFLATEAKKVKQTFSVSMPREITFFRSKKSGN